MSDEEVPDGVYIEFAGQGGRGGIIRAFRRVDGQWFRLAQYIQSRKLFELKASPEVTAERDKRVRDGRYVRVDGERGEILG